MGENNPYLLHPIVFFLGEIKTLLLNQIQNNPMVYCKLPCEHAMFHVNGAPT